jgi:Tol biopolymer transport system component
LWVENGMVKMDITPLSETGNIATYEFDVGQVRRVIDAEWSPDGNLLAITIEQGNFGGNDIYLFALNDFRVRRFLTTDRNETSISWTNDSRHLWAVSHEVSSRPFTLELITFDTKENCYRFVDAPPNVVEISWSPSGNEIAYISSGNIYKANIKDFSVSSNCQQNGLSVEVLE